MDSKPEARMAFLLLYWTGMRIGELLALTYEDIDLEKRCITINKSYQRLNGKDMITPPKTPKSNRKISIPPFLVEEVKEYCSMLYGITANERMLRFTKSFMEHEMVRGIKETGVRRIRLHDLRHSHVSYLPKLTEDLPKPFKLEGLQRIDETPVYKAVREAFVNLIIHADYLMDAGTLKIIKRNKSFEFTNPGILKLPIEDIFRGGNSKPRNPHMQTMLRMVGFGDNAGSGFPTILATWEAERWIEPKLVENTSLNQVTLELCMMPAWLLKLQELEGQIIEKLNASPEQLQAIQKSLGEAMGNISIPKTEGMEAAIVAFAKSISVLPAVQYESIGNALMEVAKQGKEISDSAKLLSDKLAEKVSESAEKSAEKITAKLSKRRKRSIACTIIR